MKNTSEFYHLWSDFIKIGTKDMVLTIVCWLYLGRQTLLHCSSRNKSKSFLLSSIIRFHCLLDHYIVDFNLLWFIGMNIYHSIIRPFVKFLLRHSRFRCSTKYCGLITNPFFFRGLCTEFAHLNTTFRGKRKTYILKLL